MAILDLRSEARLHMPALPPCPELYASARETWLARMVNEYRSNTVFEGLAAQIRLAQLPEPLAASCLEFAAEERRHGVLCGAVVEALGGEARAEYSADSEEHDVPPHADADPREALLRNLLSVSCLSETVAVALIGAERLEMPEGPLRKLLSGIYADEVGHARFGWRLASDLLPAVDPATRQRLSAYLAVALHHLERHELAHLPVDRRPPAEGSALGLCSGADARDLLYDTIGEVILPGLEALGLDAQRAWKLRQRAAGAMQS